MKRYVSYLRVSTHQQGASGLGIEAQRHAVAQFACSNGGEIISEHLEVESGNKKERPILVQSMSICRVEKATLLIAKLDRLARNVAFVSSLMEGGVDFVAVDAPYANKLMIHILAAFAEHEREQIAERTKRALAAAKLRGVKLGANGSRLAELHRSEAIRWAQDFRAPTLDAIARGANTLAALAADLNQHGLRTREGATWTPGTTARLIQRLNIDLSSCKSA